MSSNITQVVLFGSFVSHLSNHQFRVLLRAIGNLPRLNSLQLVNFDHHTPLTVEDLSYLLEIANVQNNLRELALTGGVHLVDLANDPRPRQIFLEYPLSNLRVLKSLSLAHVTLESTEEEEGTRRINLDQSQLDPLMERLPQLIPSLEQLSIRLRHRRMHLSGPNPLNPISLLAPSTLEGLLISKGMSHNNLTVLKLFQMDLDNERLCTIAESLQSNNTLKELLLQGRRSDIQPHKISSDACASLTKMIRLNKTLERFHLRGVQISDDHAMSLAQSLEHNLTMAFLRLDYPSPGPNNSHQPLLNAKKYRLIMNYYLKLNRSGVRLFVHQLYSQPSAVSAIGAINTLLEHWTDVVAGTDLDCVFYVLSNCPFIIFQYQ